MIKLIEEDIKEQKKILDWLISQKDELDLSEGPVLELSQKIDVLICMYYEKMGK